MRGNGTWSLALLLGAACVAGCHSDIGENVLYRVPVPADLEPWSTYPVEVLEIEQKGDRVKIEYPFPSWLVGEDQEVKLEGVFQEGAASFSVSGKLATGECVVTGAHFECTERLPGVVVDRAQAEASMQQAGLTPREIEQRLRVTEIFSVDPIGIVAFDAP